MNKPHVRLMIGIVGPLASGKGAVAEYLQSAYGFVSFTLSHIVHEELARRGIKNFSRKELQDIGNDLRKQFGGEILARRALEKFHKDGISLIIIEGIRNPDEVKFLRKQGDFFLIAVKAPREVRFARLSFRNKPWDPKTWKEFLKTDRRDLGQKESHNGQQVKKCMELADFTINNNTDLRRVYTEAERVVFQIKRTNSKARKLLKGF